ncbi:MAG: hypothetical protein PHC30_08825 [Lentisphaeria bacterium]|nr:hypothetical protein [Lentisphaeria bacterium]
MEKALVSFKRGLLMDGDTEQAAFQADYGLLFFLAAKCHDLQGEREQRDAMLLGAFRAFMSMPGVAGGFQQALETEYQLACRDGDPDAQPPSPWLRRIAGWSDRGELENRGIYGPALDWLERHRVSPAEQMAFNALAVVWNGEGPTMMRGGGYGHIRLIACMEPPVQPLQHALSVNQGESDDMLQWLGHVNFQATTRGGRRMDERLATQAMIKGTTQVTGWVMVGVGMAMMQGSDRAEAQLIGLGVILAGFMIDVIGRQMNPEADIRCWQCLPAEFTILPLQLPPGDHQLTIAASRGLTTLVEHSASIHAPASTPGPVLVRHLKGLSWHDGALSQPETGRDFLQQLILESAEAHSFYDPDGDGEMTAAERTAAEQALFLQCDVDGDGQLSEQNIMQALMATWRKNGRTQFR